MNPMTRIVFRSALGGLALFAGSLAAQDTGGQTPSKRKIEPVQDLADAPAPKSASAGSRAAFDRARQSLQRVRALNQQGQARRQQAESEAGGAAPVVRPPPGRKPAKGR